MNRTTRLLLVLSLVVMTARPAAGDDKDFLRPEGTRVPANLLIVFGNSQTMTQTLSFTGVNFSTFDGDADSPGSKLGAGKDVIRKFVSDFHTSYNIGLTGFSRPPNTGSIDVNRKHWVYVAVGTSERGLATVDYPGDSFQEPVGTMERWGTVPTGATTEAGPCSTKTVPDCADRSPKITLASDATVVGPFFGAKGDGTAFIYLNGNANNADQRIQIKVTQGEYGDAYTDGSLTVLKRGSGTNGTYAIEVLKEYQTKSGSTWTTATTPAGNPGLVHVLYRPLGSPVPPDTDDVVTAANPSLFYPTGATDINNNSIAGLAVGFLNDATTDFDPNATCSGLDFQQNSNQVPLIKIPRDYYWGQACNPPQDSLACVKRLLRPQAYIENYDQVSGDFTTNDPDNPGYTRAGDKYADGCESAVMGGFQAGLDHVERQVILTSRNGSQAPIKGGLESIEAYFSDPRFDGFQNGVRQDDPNKACRNTAVIFIYDTFNGCQNDSCSFLKSHVLTKLKAINIPVYTIGFGANATSGVCAGATPPEGCPLVCIPKYTGAFKADGTTPAYFPVTDGVTLYDALVQIADLVNESQKGFVSSTVSVAQASGEQVTFLATFNALNKRSIWNGRVNAYKLDDSGNLQFGTRTIRDPNDPNTGLVVPAPSNLPTSLMWNAGENLADTPGTGATDSNAILAPGAARSTGVYTDASNDSNEDIATSFYPGRKVVFSLPQGYTDPVTTLPIPASNTIPETRLDMVSPAGSPPFTSPPSWWTALKALLSPQGAPVPPAVASPPIADDDAVNSLRFIWGDRDPIILAAQPSAAGTTALYGGLKLGDIFHSSPVLVGPPNHFPYFVQNLHGYQDFRTTYQRRRRVLYFGANDGLYHAVDAGGWDRTPAQCDFEVDGITAKHCFDLGTGAEIFAYAPRATMQIFKKLKDRIGTQTKQMEWTVDGPATAGDVFIDSSYSGAPVDADRAWHTILVGGMREGSPFEGTTGTAPSDSQGSYYALDVTQPDSLTTDSNGKPVTIIPATFNAPMCINANGDATCGKDAADPVVRGNQPARAYPTVLWEITDVGDLDLSGTTGATYVDMGETWSKPALGRIKVCTANCGNATAPFPVTEDHYVAIFGGGFDRERLNRRGNWLYMVDVETGNVLYRANSSCGVAPLAGCSTYFASMPSGPAAIDDNGDGYIDRIYVGDLKGRMWKVDTTDLRQLGGTTPPTGRFANKIDFAAGSGTPFLFFEAPQPTGTNVHPFYPIYYAPTVIVLGYNVGGKPAYGIGFGTGDRDDITSSLEPLALTFKQRFYYVVDLNNTATRVEGDLLDIASPTAASVTTAPVNGWFLELNLGERLNADILTTGGVIFFPTFNPLAAGNPTNTCAQNAPKCGLANGTARLYRVFYSTGNPYLGSDRGETQPFGGFLSETVAFESKDQTLNTIFTTENTTETGEAPSPKRTSVKSWKERSRRQ
jgi:Tfp pilus tip-associated adhesin PilY1